MDYCMPNGAFGVAWMTLGVVPLRSRVLSWVFVTHSFIRAACTVPVNACEGCVSRVDRVLVTVPWVFRLVACAASCSILEGIRMG
ncbi:uncharacterized protein BO72DRAFT_73571 [Aspergillus fijiensis CBS 313.89]|uniref:Uncharacterized protein n=1 Tax=Aspergillus fijiensis CBS 313.89 TaxID=1448319 RepID=A0A8G1W2U5_9EURO|nr:uncharacterized protein BO72DRAFT_73571 [Aspergillus fijiensis CBS 313.89]RAK78424.1 hypothetical protein BO72DRAFT_73571 [Aspergillus fijiensis CBS 313.89]